MKGAEQTWGEKKIMGIRIGMESMIPGTFKDLCPLRFPDGYGSNSKKFLKNKMIILVKGRLMGGGRER